MPPSQLRGAPAVTIYEYDDQGRIARTVTRSPWTEEDRALLLAYDFWLSSLCSGRCRQPRAQSYHPDNEGNYTVTPGGPCHACGAIEQWEADHKKADLPAGSFPQLMHDRDYDADPLPAQWAPNLVRRRRG